MNEQQNLTFHLGMSNVPSDIACDDNALEESLGMLFDKGEHRPIQTPVSFGTVSCTALLQYISEHYSDVNDYRTPTNIKFLFAHKFNDITRYFFAIEYELKVKNDQNVYEWTEFTHVACGEFETDSIVMKNLMRKDEDGAWYDITNVLSYSEGMKFCSLGKSIIVTDAEGMHYYIWCPANITDPVYSGGTNIGRPVEYKCYGNGIPEPEFEFDMWGTNTFDWTGQYFSSKTIRQAALEGSGSGRRIKVNGQEDWNNCVIGLYDEVRKGLWKKNLFFGPFSVRAAIEMTDGTYYMASNPVLMLNTFSTNCIVSIDGDEVKLVLYGQELSFKAKFDYKKWSDIIRGVSLFVTREWDIFDTTKDAILTWATDDSTLRQKYYINQKELRSTTINYTVNDKYSVLERNPMSDLKMLAEEGLYYHLCDIGLSSDGWHFATEFMDSHVLENLTTRTRLSDDYMSHNKLYPSQTFVYNNRLNITNVTRDFFGGFTQFLPYNKEINGDSPSNKEYEYFVTIATDTGDYVIKKSFVSDEFQGLFFYYPDRRAKHVLLRRVLTNSYEYILDVDLKEHPALNGAYYFYGIEIETYTPAGSSQQVTRIELPTASSPATIPQPTEDAKENLSNTLITSNTNNPFVFSAKGYNNVGTGRIIGMSSNTQALSEGQHGQFPLLVFTTEGIWALSIADDGLYSAEDPMSREVVLEENPCITQTDDAVYFASAKGLMKTNGSAVVCVSEQLRDIANVIRSVMIVYDYRSSLLWLIRNDRFYAQGQPCYIYNMKTGTFSHYLKQQPQYEDAVNLYPDTLLFDIGTANSTNNNIYSFMRIPNDDNDNRNYSGELVSRPIKFGNGLTLKSLRDLKIIRDMQTNASVVLTVKASNDLKNWNTLKSFRGIPYKYFKIGLAFSGMKATDRFTGIAAIVQERRTNKLR